MIAENNYLVENLAGISLINLYDAEMVQISYYKITLVAVAFPECEFCYEDEHQFCYEQRGIMVPLSHSETSMGFDFTDQYAYLDETVDFQEFRHRQVNVDIARLEMINFDLDFDDYDNEALEESECPYNNKALSGDFNFFDSVL